MITHFENQIHVVEQGFGLAVNHYVSGRLAAAVASHGGLTCVRYHGQQDITKNVMFQASEVSAFCKLARVQVLIDDDPYYLEFNHTRHCPFGYISECVLAGVHLEHSLVLDQNVVFQRVRVLDNPSGHRVRARLLFHGNILAKMPQRVSSDWTQDRSGYFQITITDHTGDKASENQVTIGANLPVKSKSIRGSFKHYMEITDSAEAMVFYLGFNSGTLSKDAITRLDRPIEAYQKELAEGLRFETGNPAVDSALTNAAPMVMALAVPDCPGAIKASQSYWVWGWDSMVHAEAYLWSGHTDIVRDMLDFYRETADPVKGVAHAMDSDFTIRHSMAPSAQCLYTVMLYNYFAATGDRETLERNLPFAEAIVKQAGKARSQYSSLSTGLGFYPDHPQELEQELDDVSMINNSLYLQAVCALQELCGGYEDVCISLKADMESFLWDEDKGYWVDSLSEKDGSQRKYYPLYGQLYVSPFGADPKSESIASISIFLREHFLFEQGIYMFPRSLAGFMADGNQLGAYYPSVDRYYWNVMNRSGTVDATTDFERIVAPFWKEHSYPEGLTHETVNADPATDNPGGKQAFAAKSWCCDAIELNLGLRVFTNGFRLNPLKSPKAFRVYNLILRGKRIDVERIRGGVESMTLNGDAVESGFIPWEQLKPENTIRIRVDA